MRGLYFCFLLTTSAILTVGCAPMSVQTNPLQDLFNARVEEASVIAQETKEALVKTPQHEVLEITKQRVIHQMKDPESTRFRDVHIAYYKDLPAVCGEVNSKNSYGGYTGFQPFIGSPKTIRIIDSDIRSAVGASESAGYRTHCLLGEKR